MQQLPLQLRLSRIAENPIKTLKSSALQLFCAFSFIVSIKIASVFPQDQLRIDGPACAP
jgi:hypothetical protein